MILSSGSVSSFPITVISGVFARKQLCFIKQATIINLKAGNMKQTIFLLTVTATLVFQQLRADDLKYVKLIRPVTQASFSVPPSGNALTDPAGRNERAMKDFQRRMPGVDASWYVIEDGYMAKVEGAQVKTTIGYDKKGAWLYTMQASDKQLLYDEELKAIGSNYPAHRITHVQRVEHQLGNCILVYLEGKKDYRTIVMNDQSIYVMQRLLK